MPYGPDLSHVHASGFEALAEAAAIELLRHLESSEGLILDIGCGSGALTARLLTEGHRVWGLDASKDMIGLAKRRAPKATLVCGDVSITPFPQSDAIAAVGEVLNYAEAQSAGSLRRFLRKAGAALNPGGVLLFDVAAPGRGRQDKTFASDERWAVGMTAVETDGRLTRRIASFRRRAEGSWSRSDEVHELVLWPVDEVMGILEAEGFAASSSDRYGDFVLPGGLISYVAKHHHTEASNP